MNRVVDHRPGQCLCCGSVPASDIAAWHVSERKTIELPDIKPMVERHRRLAVTCPSCGMANASPLPEAAKGTPFGPRLHALATYLKTFLVTSYERLQRAFADLFGLTIDQGSLMNMLRRAQGAFVAERDAVVASFAELGSLHPMKPGCGSKAATRINGCSAVATPSSNKPPQRAALS